VTRISPQQKVLNSVGKRRVRVVDEATGEEIGRGVLKAAFLQVGDDRMTNESEIVVAADLPERD
jgi:hypothetical protein